MRVEDDNDDDGPPVEMAKGRGGTRTKREGPATVVLDGIEQCRSQAS